MIVIIVLHGSRRRCIKCVPVSSWRGLLEINMIVDSRSIDNSCRLQSEICIIGTGAAGITLALEFLSKNVSVILLESGGARSDSMTQSLYAGENAGLSYDRLEETRSRYLGGSTNCWGGWCRPLDSLDFENRDWVPNSGWPFGKEELHRHYVRSHEACIDHN
jgi:choline dehydrogenase-like flavoprotein